MTLKKTKKVVRTILDVIAGLATALLLFTIGEELYLGGTRHGGMITGFMFYGFLGSVVPYVLGRLLSERSKKPKPEKMGGC